MTAFYDLGTGVTAADNIQGTVTATSTQTGSAVNVAQRKGAGTLILDCAAGTGTSPTLSVSIQDSADGSTGWALVTHPINGAMTFTTVTTTASQQALTFDVDQCRGYIRAVGTITGTSPSFAYSVNLVSRKGP